MLSARRATVTAIRRADTRSVLLEALVDGEETIRLAVAYPDLTGAVAVGDRVVLNVTATGLRLGTGGLDFVAANEAFVLPAVFGEEEGDEHIVKLRYTPLQHAVRTAETDPANAAIWERASTLFRSPVVVCELHSQLAPVCAGIKVAHPRARIAYVMTDSAALPLALSDLVRALKAASLLDCTLTAGQAFGGDWECVSDASALLAARGIAGADVTVVAPGPGSVGTGTRFGFSGIEQGPLLDLVGRLQGTPVGVLRLSLADRRDRHRGLSHHSVTTLGLIAQGSALVALPECPPGIAPEAYQPVREAVENSPIAALHTILRAEGAPGVTLLAERGIAVTSMGRTPEQDPLFFHSAAAAGAVSASQIRHVSEDERGTG